MPRFSLENINDWLQQVYKYADTAEILNKKLNIVILSRN